METVEKQSKTWLWVIMVVVLAGVIYLLATLGGGNTTTTNSTGVVADTSPIKIGFIGPLTKDAAAVGENMLMAVKIAQDEINAAGGINKRKVEVIFEDGQCGPKEAANAGNKLINVDKVVAIIGGACSSETLAVAPIAEQSKIPLISAASTNSKITEAGDYIFRFIPSDSFQGKFAAEYLVNTLGKKKVGILYVQSDWGVGIKDIFKKRLTEIGGQVVSEEGYQQTSRDFRSQITKVKAAKPDIIYFLGYTEETIAGLKQMKDLAVKIPIFGGDAWDDPKIPQEAGVAAEGATFSITANRNLPQSFIDEMNKRTSGKEIANYSPRAYDIVKALADIIGRVGTDSVQIKDQLYKMSDYKGIADIYTLDSNGDLTVANYTIKGFKNGKIVEIK